MNNQREILFRGFHPCEDGETTIYVEGRAVKGRWVEGFYFSWNNGIEQLFQIQTINKQGHLGVIYEVIPATVCQYIGLTDKNGRKVFEGDCIQTYFSFAPCDAGYGVLQKPFYVEWEQGRTAFRAKKPNANGMHLLDMIDFFAI